MNGPHGWARKYQRRLLWSDFFVVTVVMFVAQILRVGWEPSGPVSGPSAPPYWFVSVAIALLWLLNLSWSRTREARVLGHGPQEYQRVVAASWHTFATVAVVGFLTQWQISRGYLLFALPFGTVVLLIYRALWRMWIHAQRDGGELQAQVLVVGPLRTSEQMMRRLLRSRRAGYNVVGVCLPPTSRRELSDDLIHVPVLGAIDDAVDVAQRVGAEYILLSGNDEMSLNEARRLGWSLEGTGIGLIVAPAMVDIAGPRVMMSPVEGLPLLHVDPAEFSGSKYFFKSATDRVSAALILMVLGVPMMAIALLVKLTSPGPVFFKQERIGRNGAPFRMLKFRSMVPDADAQLAAVMGGSVGVYYKAEDDPRVTSFGRFMRRYSLDELPQILNVLKGDMSLVGPRPQVLAEVEQYTDLAHRRLLVKPGMTGLWQVSGRSGLEPEQAIRLDAYYAENWSLVGDLVIMARTIKAVVGGDGAY